MGLSLSGLQHCKYSEGNLRANANSFSSNDWVYISKYQSLSEELISEFQDKVDWWWISKYQLLSEAFILKFKYKDSFWHLAIKYQKLSLEFIIEHKEHIQTYWLKDNKHLTKEDRTKLKLMGIL